jgi:putative ABC transport system permease protein
MNGRVPLARRYVFAERRRAAMATVAIAVAFLLVLILDGIFAGAMSQVTAYIRHSPADVIVSQSGVRTMHMSVSSLPEDVTSRVHSVSGVSAAQPIWFASGAVGSSSGRELSYVIGYTPGELGGPTQLVSGHAPAHGEAVLDTVAAGQLGLHLGDQVRVLGTDFRIVGLSSGGTSIVNTTTFISAADFAAIRGASPSYVLVTAQAEVSPGELRDRIAAAVPGVTVQTRDEFASQEALIVSDMSSDILSIGSTIAFVIALAVIGLTLFTLTLARIRDYGVLKAIGARPRRLAGLVIAQAAWSIGLAVVASVALALVVSAVVVRVAPTLDILVTVSSVARVAVAATAIGIFASLLPLRRVLAVDAASAFRRAS